MLQDIYFTLNGEHIMWSGSPAARLLDVLREEYRNTGVKCGCLEGECGACSVIIDGKLANSCLIAMGRVAGLEIITIEGYRKTRQFAALDKAFAAESAAQCGFCTPGMILAAECLLRKNPQPTETEIRTGISGNLCRCTGYNAIVKAIDSAAKENIGLW
jgi:carbon-monoxide dehydrogenase small subunit